MNIRDLKMNDAPRMLEWMLNPDINQYFQHDFAFSNINTAENFIASSLEHKQSQINLAITDNNNLYQGTISLKHIDIINRHAEYAICLHPDAIGQGYAGYATKKILKIGFMNYNLNKIYLNVITENIRAVKFYENFGFIKEGEFKEHLIIRNKIFDLAWYRLLAEEFSMLRFHDPS